MGDLSFHVNCTSRWVSILTLSILHCRASCTLVPIGAQQGLLWWMKHICADITITLQHFRFQCVFPTNES